MSPSFSVQVQLFPIVLTGLHESQEDLGNWSAPHQDPTQSRLFRPV